MITSTANPQVKQLVQWQSEAKARRRDGVFVVEGVKMLEEAPADRIRDIYLTEELEQRLWDGKSEREKALWSKIKQNGYETLSFEVMKKAADTQTPQGVLAVLERPVYEKEEMLAVKNGFFLVLEDLQDPGNLGTIIRTGEGAGVNGVFLSKNTVDIFNPKTIRSTMGSIYRVPFLYVESFADLLLEMKEKVQEQLASVAKSKKEFKKEENLIDSILHGEGRARVIERTMPEPEIQEISDMSKQNTKKANIPDFLESYVLCHNLRRLLL